MAYSFAMGCAENESPVGFEHGILYPKSSLGPSRLHFGDQRTHPYFVDVKSLDSLKGAGFSLTYSPIDHNYEGRRTLFGGMKIRQKGTKDVAHFSPSECKRLMEHV